MPHTTPPRFAAAKAPVPTAGHCWPVPLQENMQTLKGRSGSVSCGGHCSFPLVLVCTGLFVPSKHLWQVWGLILNVILPLLPACQGLSFALGCGVFFFFGGILHSLVDGCSAASYYFWCSYKRRWAHVLLLRNLKEVYQLWIYRMVCWGWLILTHQSQLQVVVK